MYANGECRRERGEKVDGSPKRFSGRAEQRLASGALKSEGRPLDPCFRVLGSVKRCREAD